jgi:uncharacterized protein
MVESVEAALDARLLVAAIVVAGAGFMRGFIGFGAALMTVPALAWAYGPLVAIAVSSMISMASTLALLPTAIRLSERSVVVPIGVGVFVAAPVGTWVLVSVDPTLMRMAISLLVVVMVALLARGWQFTRDIHRGFLIGAGLVGGLVQGVAGIGGPPVVAVALSRPGPTELQRANVLGVMTAIALSAIAPLAWYGLFTVEVLIVGAILMPLNYAATRVGSRYFSGGGHRYYRGAALAVLAIIGFVTMAAAVRDFWA